MACMVPSQCQCCSLFVALPSTPPLPDELLATKLDSIPAESTILLHPFLVILLATYPQYYLVLHLCMLLCLLPWSWSCPTLSYKEKVWLLSGFLVGRVSKQVHAYMIFIACSWCKYFLVADNESSVVINHSPSPGGTCTSLLELLSYHPNTCIVLYQRTDKHFKDSEWCWITEQTLFSTVEMCQFSFRFFPMSFFPTNRVFALGFFPWFM